MPVKSNTIQLTTRGHADMLDITQRVIDCIQNSGMSDGIVTIFCPSSTSALTTIEYEPGVLQDLRQIFDELIPPNRIYLHDEAWHDGNGYSHVRSALLKASLTVPLVNGRMTLGTWQQIVYIDFDNRARKRELVVQIIGE